MGWENSHLHQFIKDRTFYTERIPGDDTWVEMNNVDYKKIKISDVLKKEKEKIIYEYDFGDGWVHDVLLEKILPGNEKMIFLICLEGKMACPPEDCGGVWGYSDMLEILKQPKHEEYDNIIEWLGEEFDPEHFDKEEVNNILKRLKIKGI
jgi:hypothetical protein